MTIFLTVVLAVLLLSILGVLVYGVVSMGKGGAEGARQSNRMMRWRVLLQFAALGIIVLLFLLHGA